MYIFFLYHNSNHTQIYYILFLRILYKTLVISSKTSITYQWLADTFIMTQTTRPHVKKSGREGNLSTSSIDHNWRHLTSTEGHYSLQHSWGFDDPSFLPKNKYNSPLGGSEELFAPIMGKDKKASLVLPWINRPLFYTDGRRHIAHNYFTSVVAILVYFPAHIFFTSLSICKCIYLYIHTYWLTTIHYKRQWKYPLHSPTCCWRPATYPWRWVLGI